jgi:hypothetical protein
MWKVIYEVRIGSVVCHDAKKELLFYMSLYFKRLFSLWQFCSTVSSTSLSVYFSSTSRALLNGTAAKTVKVLQVVNISVRNICYAGGLFVCVSVCSIGTEGNFDAMFSFRLTYCPTLVFFTHPDTSFFFMLVLKVCTKFLWGTNWISLSFCSGDVTWFLWGTNLISLSFCNGDVTWFPWGTNWISLSFCSGDVTWFSWGTNWISLSFCSGDVTWFPWGTNWISLSFCSGDVIDLESREHGRRDPSRWPRVTLYPQKLVLTSPTSSGRSVVILRLRTKATV